eukprot:TRINITY_DN2763_c2_g1_i2.p1 TRINITY_DN2763_c2_g1~~TRINITY_DN2763_c2_g1_i2.p1  ORF type:complete len:497 (+),score=113.51 TRINITY_DN2763_c2_g1_i2:36-1526(+)
MHTGTALSVVRRHFSVFSRLIKHPSDVTCDEDLALYIKSHYHPERALQGEASAYCSKVYTVLTQHKRVVGHKSIIAVMDVTSKLHQAKWCQKVFDLSTAMGLPSSSVMYHQLMSGYSRDGDLATVAKLIKEMLQTVPRAKMNRVTYFMLLRALAKNGKIEECLEVMRQMQGTGVRVDSKMVSTVVAGCTTHEQIQQLRQGTPFSKSFFTEALVTAYVGMDDMAAAERAVAYMLRHQPEGTGDVVWLRLASGYAARGDVLATRKTWHRMVKWGVLPTHKMYVALMLACLKAAKAKDDAMVMQAEHVFNTACAKGFAHKPTVWSTLLRCYEKVSDFEKFFILLKVCPPSLVRRLNADTRDIITVHAHKAARYRQALGGVDVPPLWSLSPGPCHDHSTVYTTHLTPLHSLKMYPIGPTSPGIQPLPHLRFDGQGYQIGGVTSNWASKGQKSTVGTPGGGTYVIAGSKMWNPELGPTHDAIANGLAEQSVSLNNDDMSFI